MGDVEARNPVDAYRVGRLETLADGVFAIAMTILILEFHVPDSATSGDLHAKLFALLPRLGVYALSFILLGAYWVGHHAQYENIHRADRNLLWINIVFLMVICIVPFTTSLLGSYGDDRLIVDLYGANLILIGLVFLWHWSYVTKGHRLVDAGLDEKIIYFARFRILIAPTFALIGILVAFISPRAAIFVYLAGLVPAAVPGVATRQWLHLEKWWK